MQDTPQATSQLSRTYPCLSELFELLVGVGVELLGYVLHPHERPAVPSPLALHPPHRQPRVLDGALPKRLHLLRWRKGK